MFSKPSLLCLSLCLTFAAAGLSPSRADEGGEREKREKREKREAPPKVKQGRASGILVGKDAQGRWIEVLLDGETEARRFTPHWRGGAPAKGGGLDEKMRATIRGLIVSNRVELSWAWEERYRVEAIEVATPKRKRGVIKGRIVRKGETWIDVASKRGPAVRYLPHWRGGAPAKGGGLDKDVLRQLRELKVGQEVELEWEFDERPRVVRVR